MINLCFCKKKKKNLKKFVGGWKKGLRERKRSVVVCVCDVCIYYIYSLSIIKNKRK